MALLELDFRISSSDTLDETRYGSLTDASEFRAIGLGIKIDDFASRIISVLGSCSCSTCSGGQGGPGDTKGGGFCLMGLLDFVYRSDLGESATAAASQGSGRRSRPAPELHTRECVCADDTATPRHLRAPSHEKGIFQCSI